MTATPGASGGSTPSGSDKDSSASSSGAGVSIAVSAIVAAVWTGLWGFNWAASHLSSWQLYGAILLGLIGGISTTVLVIWKSMGAIQMNLDAWERVAKYAIDHGQNPPPQHGGVLKTQGLLGSPSGSIACRGCGWVFPLGEAKFCPNCGQKLTP
jgi:hypothetical protein